MARPRLSYGGVASQIGGVEFQNRLKCWWCQRDSLTKGDDLLPFVLLLMESRLLDTARMGELRF